MSNARPDSEDDERLRQLGYQPELARRMSGFSNFAISLSIICILAGGITSFQVGLNSAGGASLGLGWPLGRRRFGSNLSELIAGEKLDFQPSWTIVA